MSAAAQARIDRGRAMTGSGRGGPGGQRGPAGGPRRGPGGPRRGPGGARCHAGPGRAALPRCCPADGLTCCQSRVYRRRRGCHQATSASGIPCPRDIVWILS